MPLLRAGRAPLQELGNTRFRAESTKAAFAKQLQVKLFSGKRYGEDCVRHNDSCATDGAHRPNQKLWFLMCAFLTKYQDTVICGHFEPCTSSRYRSDRKGELNSVFDALTSQLWSKCVVKHAVSVAKNPTFTRLHFPKDTRRLHDSDRSRSCTLCQL